MIDVKNNELLRQFELKTESNNVTVEYSFQEKKLFLTRLSSSENTTPEIVEEVLKKIMEVAEDNRWRVVPTKPNISQFFKKNPSYKELLAPGIRI
nr:N-acetyltransferase [uncultured Flavobacterium sp.]